MNIETSFTLVPSDKITLNILELTNTAKELFFVSGKDLTVGEYYSVIGHNGYYHYLNEVIFTESYENNIIYYVQKYNDRLFKVVDKYHCISDSYKTYIDLVSPTNFDFDSVISFGSLTKNGMGMNHQYDFICKLYDIEVLSHLYTNGVMTFSWFSSFYQSVLKNKRIRFSSLHDCFTLYKFSSEDIDYMLNEFFKAYALTFDERVNATHNIYEHSKDDADFCHKLYPYLMKHLNISELIKFAEINSCLNRPILTAYIVKEFINTPYTIADVYAISISIPNITTFIGMTFYYKLKLTFLRIFK